MKAYSQQVDFLTAQRYALIFILARILRKIFQRPIIFLPNKGIDGAAYFVFLPSVYVIRTPTIRRNGVFVEHADAPAEPPAPSALTSLRHTTSYLVLRFMSAILSKSSGRMISRYPFCPFCLMATTGILSSFFALFSVSMNSGHTENFPRSLHSM